MSDVQAYESYRAICRRNSQSHIHRATNFGDVMTAEHKVVNDEGESRNNQRFAIVVQDLATQWILSYPCKTRTSHETGRNLRNVVDPEENPRLYTQTIRWNLEKLVKTVNGTIVRPHSSAGDKRNCRKISKKSQRGHFIFFSLQSGLDEQWWAQPMECCCYCRNVQDLLSDGNTPHERRCEEQFSGPVIPFGATGNSKRAGEAPQVGKKVLSSVFMDYALYTGGSWK